MVGEHETQPTKVFISYSRSDVEFVDQLYVALQARGFDPILDRHEIGAAEEWRARLGALIASADSAVFVLSQASCGSEVFAWEVEEAARLGKRMLPVLPMKLMECEPHTLLRPLNWIHFYGEQKIPGSGIFDGLLKLETALNVDLPWLREQTRLTLAAKRWEERSRSTDELLRGAQLRDAQNWSGCQPNGAEITDVIRTFIVASDEEEKRQEEAARLQIAEREAALVAAERASSERETALEQKARSDQKTRSIAQISMVVGIVLTTVAVISFIGSTLNSVRADQHMSELFAEEANKLSRNNDFQQAAMFALWGDPAALGSWERRVVRPDGFQAATAALERAVLGNRLMGEYRTEGEIFVPVAFLADEERFLTGSFGGVKEWQVGSFEAVRTYAAPGATVTQIIVRPGSDQFLAAFEDGTIIRWTIGVPDPEELAPASGDAVTALAVSPDGNRIAAGDEAGRLRVWDLRSAAKVTDLPAHAQQITSVSYLGSGERLITASADGTAKFWSEATEQPEAVSEGIGEWINAISANEDGTSILIGSKSGVRRWRPGRVSAPGRISGPMEEVTVLRQLDENGSFVTGASDGAIRFWDLTSDPEIAVLQRSHAGSVEVYSMDYAEDRKQLLVGRVGDGVQLWGAADRFLRLSGAIASDRVSALAVSPDEESMLVGAEDGAVFLLKPGENLSQARLPGNLGRVAAAGFSDDARAFVAAADGLSLWRLGDDPEPIEMVRPRASSFSTVAKFPDGEGFAAGYLNGAVEVLSGEGLGAVRSFEGHSSEVTSISISPRGDEFLTASDDGTIGHWRVDSDLAVTNHTGHGERVNAVAFLPDGSHFLSASSDGTLKYWALRQETAITTYTGNGGAIVSLSIHPNGEHFLTTDGEGAAVIWRLGEEEPIASLTSPAWGSSIAAFSLGGDLVAVGSLHGGVGVWEFPSMLQASPRRKVELACAALKNAGQLRAIPEADIRGVRLAADPLVDRAC